MAEGDTPKHPDGIDAPELNAVKELEPDSGSETPAPEPRAPRPKPASDQNEPADKTNNKPDEETENEKDEPAREAPRVF